MELQFIILHVHEHPLQQKVCEIKLNNILDKWICSIPSTHEMARNMSGPDNMWELPLGKRKQNSIKTTLSLL